jgi:Predicted ATPase related to phosphate starvation-inducible protein PhoH
MKHLVLDTNVYIHYVDFEQIKWKDIFGEDISIIIPPKVQREIDKIKDQSTNSKIRKRAKHVSVKIADFLLDHKDGKYKIRSCEDPRPNQFDEDIFNPNVDDNWILLSAIRLREDENLDVIIVSADTNILVKAKQIGLAYHRMTEDFKLSEEPTEEEKEINQLKSELRKYTTRLSKPTLLFHNHQQYLKIQKPTVTDVNDMVKMKLEEEKRKHPYATQYDTSDFLDSSIRNMMSSIFGEPSANDVATYNTDLNEYLKEYEQFIRFKCDYESILSNMFKLEFVLVNSGTNPTGDIHLFLRFPSNIQLYSKQNIKRKHLNEPIAPSPISFGYSMLVNRNMQKEMASMAQIKFDPVNGAYDTRPTFPYWDLSLNAKYDYHIQKDSLPHNMEMPILLDELYVNLIEINSFKIEYSILDSSLIDPIKGSLEVIIEQ